MFESGSKVQAVDDLGRWEEARVLTELSEGRYTVKFVGWSQQFNRLCLPSEIRSIVDPFKEDFRNRHGKRAKLSAAVSDVTRTLCRGDVVHVNGLGDATLMVVDRYRRSITISTNGEQREIPATDVSIPTVTEPERPERPQKLQKKKDITQAPVATDHAHHVHMGVQTQQVSITEQSDWATDCFMNKSGTNIVVGNIYSLPYGLVGAVRRLNFHKVSFSPPVSAIVHILKDGELATDVSVHLPIDKLASLPEKPVLSRGSKVLIGEVQAASKAEGSGGHLLTLLTKPCQLGRSDRSQLLCMYKVIQNLLYAGPIYRHMYRRNQLATALRKDVALGLKTKSRTRRFTLGLASMEVDPQIFGIGNRRKVFNYKGENLHELDVMLGDRWDVACTDVGPLTQFVTQLSVWVTKDGYLAGSVRTAVCRETISTTKYREDLQKHLTNELVDAADDSDEDDIMVEIVC